MKVLVSSCLLGERVRYDGRCVLDKENELTRLLSGCEIIPFCPELAGGMSVPREPAEIAGGTVVDIGVGNGRVVTRSGSDVTDHFIEGAQAALRLCKDEGVKLALLTEKSPSCGTEKVYDGSFSGRLIDGVGVTTALLRANGITVFNQYQLPLIQRYLELVRH